MELKYIFILLIALISLAYICISNHFSNYRLFVFGDRYNSKLYLSIFLESFGFVEVVLIFYSFYKVNIISFVIFFLFIVFRLCFFTFGCMHKLSHLYGIGGLVDILCAIFGKKFQLYFSVLTLLFITIFLSCFIKMFLELANIILGIEYINYFIVLIFIPFFIHIISGMNIFINLKKVYTYLSFSLLFILASVIFFHFDVNCYKNFNITLSDLMKFDTISFDYLLLIVCIPLLTPSTLHKSLTFSNIFTAFKGIRSTIYLYPCIFILFYLFYLTIEVISLEQKISIANVLFNVLLIDKLKPFFCLWFFLSFIITCGINIGIFAHVCSYNICSNVFNFKYSDDVKLLYNRIFAVISILIATLVSLEISLSFDFIVFVLCAWQLLISIPAYVYLFNMNCIKLDNVIMISLFFMCIFLILSFFLKPIIAGNICICISFFVLYFMCKFQNNFLKK